MRNIILSFIVASIFWFISANYALAQSPPITITITSTSTDYIFTTPRNPENWLVIMDGLGQPVFTKTQSASFFDFKTQYGLLTYFNQATGYFEVLDKDYQLVDTWQAVNEATDNHDLQLLDNGNALLLVYKPYIYDLTAYGGHVTATVYSCVIQEIKPDKTLAWEWDGLNYNPISDTNRSLTTPVVDYDHCNAVELDNDGNILLSSRHLDQITKIDKQTGNVIWKLGGKSNQFTFVNDTGFALQHDIRRLPSSHITIFDNGTPSRGYSRAVEFEIDEANKIITKTWEYIGPFAFCCGNAQRLENGNTFINFGPGHPTIREVTPEGEVVFEADTNFSYRSFKLPWFRKHYLPIVIK